MKSSKKVIVSGRQKGGDFLCHPGESRDPADQAGAGRGGGVTSKDASRSVIKEKKLKGGRNEKEGTNAVDGRLS